MAVRWAARGVGGGISNFGPRFTGGAFFVRVGGPNGIQRPKRDAPMSEKPRLVLLGAPFTAEAIAQLFREMTGRDPSPEDMAEVEALLREHGAQLPDDGAK